MISAGEGLKSLWDYVKFFTTTEILESSKNHSILSIHSSWTLHQTRLYNPISVSFSLSPSHRFHSRLYVFFDLIFLISLFSLKHTHFFSINLPTLYVKSQESEVLHVPARREHRETERELFRRRVLGCFPKHLNTDRILFPPPIGSRDAHNNRSMVGMSGIKS